MQRKQNVTSRRYFVRKSSTTPDADSSALDGGFKYLSRFSGSSRPLKRAALLRICFTSLTRPLHRSQRGDSGTTNLSAIENKTLSSLSIIIVSFYFGGGQTSVLTICFSFSRHRVEKHTWNSFITLYWPVANYEYLWLNTRHMLRESVLWSRNDSQMTSR